MTANKDEEIKLLPMSKNYGTLRGSQTLQRHENARWMLMFDDCHWYDWLCVVVALLCSVATGFLIPIATVVSMQPTTLTLAFEELARNETTNQSLLQERGTTLLKSNANFLYLCFGITVLQVSFNTASMYLFGLFATRTANSVRQRYVQAILYMEIRHSQETSAGQLCDMLDENLNKVSDALENSLPMAITLIFQYIVSIIVSIMILWPISLFVIIMVFLFIVIYYGGAKFCVRMVIVEQSHISNASQIANECFTAIKTVLCLNAQEYTISRHNSEISKAMQASRKRAIVSGIVDACKQVAADILPIVGLLLGALEQDQSIAANLFAVMSMCYYIGVSMPMFNMHMKIVYMAVACADNLTDMLDKNSKAKHHSNLNVSASDIKEGISFEHVSFCYPSRPDVQALDDICLEIGAGQKVAIVGESGCGKSTIVKLLMRFFQPNRGRITIDSCPVDRLDTGSLRSLTGLVSQEPALFNMSLLENFTCVHETATHEEIAWALKQANAMEFVSQLPDVNNIIRNF